MAGCCSSRTTSSAGDVVVVVFHDHGSRYMAKMFNDEWMRSKGFFEVMGMTAREPGGHGRRRRARCGGSARPVEDAAKLMSTHDFSQVSVTKNGRIDRIAERDAPLRGAGGNPESACAGGGHHAAGLPVRRHLHAGGTAGDDDQPAEPAVLVRDFTAEKTYIITRSDIIRVLM
jgi:cystathionine beta-synthase